MTKPMTIREFLDVFKKVKELQFLHKKEGGHKIGDVSKYTLPDGNVGVLMPDRIANACKLDLLSPKWIVGDNLTIGKGIETEDPFKVLSEQILDDNPFQFVNLYDPFKSDYPNKIKYFENTFVSIRMIEQFTGIGFNPLTGEEYDDSSTIQMMLRFDVYYVRRDKKIDWLIERNMLDSRNWNEEQKALYTLTWSGDND